MLNETSALRLILDIFLLVCLGGLIALFAAGRMALIIIHWLFDYDNQPKQKRKRTAPLEIDMSALLNSLNSTYGKLITMNPQRYPFEPEKFAGIDFGALRAAQQARNEELKAKAEQEAHHLRQKQEEEAKYFRAYFLELGIGFDEVIFDGDDVDFPWGRVGDLWFQQGNSSARILQGDRLKTNGIWFGLPTGNKLPSEWHPEVRRNTMADIASTLDQFQPQSVDEILSVPYLPAWYGALNEIPDDDDDEPYSDNKIPPLPLNGGDEPDDYDIDEEYEALYPLDSENEETAWANNYLSQYGFTLSSQHGGSDEPQ